MEATRAVTHDISDYSDLSLAADGHTLAAVLQQSHYNVFVAPTSASGSGQAEQITSDPPVYDFSWTPDGQMILTNSTDFTLNLFNLGSSSKTPLTSPQDGFAFQPSPCADGRYVVFSLANHGAANAVTIWRMDAGGGNLKQLSDGRFDGYAVCSSDRKWVFYLDISNGIKLTKVPLDGGKPERLLERSGIRIRHFSRWQAGSSCDGSVRRQRQNTAGIGSDRFSPEYETSGRATPSRGRHVYNPLHS